MVRNATALQSRATAAHRDAGRAYWAVRNGADASDHLATVIDAHARMLPIIRQFREWNDLPPHADFRWYWGDIETMLDFVKMEVSAIRQRKREAAILKDREAVDEMRPASAHIDRPIRSRRTYRLPPRPAMDTTSTPAISEVMSQDAALVAVRALVERLPDETRLPECTLNARYIRLSRRRTPEDPAPVTESEMNYASFGMIQYVPTRVVTVGDLRRLSHEELIALPRTGRRTIITVLAKMAREHGLDASFAEDPARVVPCSPQDRVVHALALGLAVAHATHDSHTGRTHRCVRAYEVVDGALTESSRTAAYNETDGHVAGLATNTWPFKDLVEWRDEHGRRVAALTQKGRERATKLLAA